MVKGFHIQTVTIEGFKGFTTQQEIDLQGRHVFLLGQNGNGKSSIIEAIRWGLFGSTGRPNEIVANRNYSGRCRVDITLMREGKPLNFQRTLIRGISGGSDAILKDEHGQEHHIRDIMPQLDSVDAGEETHIIFAPQATPLRRQPEDLTAFERTVFNHLGLTHPRALLSQMNSFLLDQEITENNLDKKLTNVRDDLNNQIDNLTRQQSNILSLRPWGSDHLPSASESENKVRDLIKEITSKQPDDAISRLKHLESRLEEAEEFENEAQRLRNELTEMERRANEIRAGIDPDDAKEFSEQINLDDLYELINRCSKLKASIDAQIDGQEEGLDEIRRRLSNLREEAKFHQIKNELSDLKRSRNRFAEVKKAYDELVLFGESVRTIQQTVESCLKEQLKKDIPEVSESLSQVFAALTRHPWFDQLTIARDKLPKLELQVASSQDPSGNEHPTGVLNGQAESALDLVPYFAFSQSDNAPTEVYLVLLDDPTRAFDEEHTKILVERLADLGNHVQLMVASQETARFRELLPKNFERSSYVVIEPTHWSYHNGPELEIEYE